MKEKNKFNRRSFIETAGLVAAGFYAMPLFSSCKSDTPSAHPNVGNAVNNDFDADIDIQLKAVQSSTKILSSKNTDTYSYRGSLVKGDKQTLQQLEGSALGPIIRVKKGDRVRIRFENEIPDKSIIHWHGLHVSHENDGHPEHVIEEGETYFYEFEVMNRAGTYWFHPHPHGHTGEQVYRGLAGLFIVTDEEEKGLNLPTGDYDVPVVIQDRTFDENNQLVYLPNGKMDQMLGFLGNRILINGKIDNTLSLNKDGKYRLRLLNGSNSRAYKLAWGSGEPITVFGVDGGLLGSPKILPYLMLGPAQRVDVWLDLSKKSQNEELKLIHLPIPLDNMMSGGMMGGGMMGGGMMGNQSDNSLPYNSQFDILNINVGASRKNDASLPDRLPTYKTLNPTDVANRTSPRTFNFGMEEMMEWTINGRTYNGMEVADEEIVKLNTTEVWRINNGGNSTTESQNDGGGMMGMRGNGGMMGNGSGMGNMMQMPHPVHIHQLQFNIINRNTDNVDRNLWNAVKDGIVDEGWQDSVYLLPGMYMDLVMRFEDFKGLFLYHCHNLEHEDMGMMRNFKIE
ncbi:hypothetical protein SAMN05421636_102252 [Pricia antarctica]|uniref:Multicopper oxidase CueO n=1 Tax=Pricia antarctica TaxID=641691 RepID=A0A1G6YGT0_9FLAO|nr:multicopper oxidase domain-containing protein [Pricia antarctica]SDD89570.1 hypothetical protein SAMN05421636_102252 [Pricia antarctica]